MDKSWKVRARAFTSNTYVYCVCESFFRAFLPERLLEVLMRESIAANRKQNTYFLANIIFRWEYTCASMSTKFVDPHGGQRARSSLTKTFSEPRLSCTYKSNSFKYICKAIRVLAHCVLLLPLVENVCEYIPQYPVPYYPHTNIWWCLNVNWKN